MMKKNILMRTNLLVCLVIIIGFLLTAVLSYRANYSASLENIEQVSSLTSEGIYYQMSSTFTKPVNISLTMANDSLLKDVLQKEKQHMDEREYINTIKEYLQAYQEKYAYDSVFLVSAATGRYYNFNGLDRVLTPGEAENHWYFNMLQSDADYTMQVDNDEVSGAENQITVFVNCKIKDTAGAVMGVVGVGLRIDSLQQLLQEYENKFGVMAYLVDDGGTIEISTKHTGYEGVNLFEMDQYAGKARADILGWREEGTAKGLWVSDQAANEKKSYVVTRYLPELSWHLVVERDTSQMVAQLNRQLVHTVLIIFSIIVLILFVITYVIRSFNRRIVGLTQAVEQERRTVFEKATEQLFENIYELDITNNRPANQATEAYFESLGAPKGIPYDKALAIIARQIKEEFRQGYLDTFSTENVQKSYAQGRETLRYEFMITNGDEYYWMRITARLVQWEGDGTLHMLVYRQNIDVEKRQEQKMQELAQTDEMTGLYTKTATRQRIEQQLRAQPGQTYAFFIFDIDQFKQANDQYGHAFGDGVIVRFTAIIKGRFSKDTLIGRIGGDEFAAFTRVDRPEQAAQQARELSAALHCVQVEGEKNWCMSASIGVAVARGSETTFEMLYQNADDALYETKKKGRNGYTIYRGGEHVPSDSGEPK